jgi:hypothetical protein
MPDTKLAFTPLRPAEEEFFSRAKLAKRWDCSEKAVLGAEKRLGLRPYRILRAIKYTLSDILLVEREGLAKMPKKFTGLRPDQKAELTTSKGFSFCWAQSSRLHFWPITAACSPDFERPQPPPALADTWFDASNHLAGQTSTKDRVLER